MQRDVGLHAFHHHFVERALEAYEVRETGQEPAADFFRRLNAECSTDVDLDKVLAEIRKPYVGIDL